MEIDYRNWDLPKYKIIEIKKRLSKYCVCIPIINEGERIINQLTKMYYDNIQEKVDIIICDGGSTDGSTEINTLKKLGVRTLLVMTDNGVIGAQLRMGYAYALKEGYGGIITMDGNDKDHHDVIDRFILKLDEGYDYVQGSRFISGGKAINTPLFRHLAIKYFHVPFINMVSGYKYTDTTNGNRAYSKKLLTDKRIEPFRKIFVYYDFLVYISSIAPKLGFKVIEVPMIRKYPKGKIPTKISFYKGNLRILISLFNVLFKRYLTK